MEKPDFFDGENRANPPAQNVALKVTSGVLVHLHVPPAPHGFVSMSPTVARQVAFDLLSAAHRTENLTSL